MLIPPEVWKAVIGNRQNERVIELLTEINKKLSRVLTEKQKPVRPRKGRYVIRVPDSANLPETYIFNTYKTYAAALTAAREMFGADEQGNIQIVVPEEDS